MPLPNDVASAFDKAGIKVVLDAPLSKRVWWCAGGVADAFVRVESTSDLQYVLRVARDSNIPVFPIGNGSNLLVSDSGIRGVVVQLGGELAQCGTPKSGVIELGAGLKLMVLQKRALDEKWTGLECFAGIPGTVGGAVRMNAGSNLGEVKDRLRWADVIRADGSLERLTLAQMKMSYRTTQIPDDAVVVRAAMQLSDEDPAEHSARVRVFLERRKATQPLDLPSCGSTFRNPDGDHAGRLIQASGLKGFRIGAAQVSEKHANFIVNLGGATASDIRKVIEEVQRIVFEEHGVSLHPEVHFAGDWSGWTESS